MAQQARPKSRYQTLFGAAPVEEPVDHLIDAGGDDAAAVVARTSRPSAVGGAIRFRFDDIHSRSFGEWPRHARRGSASGAATRGRVRLDTFCTPRGSPLIERIHSRSPFTQT